MLLAKFPYSLCSWLEPSVIQRYPNKTSMKTAYGNLIVMISCVKSNKNINIAVSVILPTQFDNRKKEDTPVSLKIVFDFKQDYQRKQITCVYE